MSTMRVIAEPIDTARLILEPLRVDHAAPMTEVLADPALHEFIGGTPATTAELRTRYERMLAGPEDPAVSWCNWVIRHRERDELVGTVQATVTPTPDGPQAEIAWIVGTPWQGQGIAAEAATALTNWLLHQRITTVIAHSHPYHHASAVVAVKAGLAPTGDLHDGEIRWRMTASTRGE